MRAQLCVIADAANVSVDGKLNILGEFNLFNVQSVPLVWPTMMFVAKVMFDLNDFGRPLIFHVRLVDDDMNLVGSQIELQVTIPLPPNDATTLALPIIMPIQNAQFVALGIYTFQLLANGQRIGEAPLTVRLAPPAQ